MPARSDERATFLADIIIAAVEGGTGYWASVSAYKWTDGPEVTTATLHPEDEPGAAHVVTLDVIAHGFAAIRENDRICSAGLRALIVAADRSNDAGDVDADAADAIVQAALFGELVYG